MRGRARLRRPRRLHPAHRSPAGPPRRSRVIRSCRHRRHAGGVPRQAGHHRLRPRGSGHRDRQRMRLPRDPQSVPDRQPTHLRRGRLFRSHRPLRNRQPIAEPRDQRSGNRHRYRAVTHPGPRRPLRAGRDAPGDLGRPPQRALPHRRVRVRRRVQQHRAGRRRHRRGLPRPHRRIPHHRPRRHRPDPIGGLPQSRGARPAGDRRDGSPLGS